VLDRIGVGGMGVVWQAMDERLERLVAVKQLLMQPQRSPGAADEARARAMREARIAARLQHPNAIVIYDVAEHDGEPCLVMEYLPSRSLAAVLGERGCLPVSEVASIGKQIASALAAAHAAQIVHRDVKPGNILITDDGTAKITDFGVSRAAGDVTVTQTGIMAGTPAYLAPEVARGQVPTPASDVFSLGATLYAAIEGQGPFGESENSLALLHAVAGGRLNPPQHAGALSAVLMRLLATDPAARPDMHHASLELAVVAATRPVRTTATVPRTARKPKSAKERRPAAAVVPPQVPRLPETRPAEGGTLLAGHADPLPSTPPQVPSSPDWPAEGFPARPKQRRRGALVGALLVLLAAFAGTGMLLSEGSSWERGAHPSGQAAPSVPAAKPAPAPAPVSSPPQVARVGHAQPIGWSDAGQLVINYYNGLDNPSSAWQLLSPTAQAVFGNESDFQSHWSQYSWVSARNAFGVTDNPDGSVRVPVDVTYHTAGGDQVVKRVLRVTRLDGHLLIDSDPR
jgi:serine/threonine protein kinase